MKRLLVLWLTLICFVLGGCGQLIPAPTTTQVEMPDTDCIEYVDIRYQIQQLPKKEFIDFCAMYESIMAFETVCDLPYPVVEGYADRLVRLLQYECPELIQLDSTETIYYTMENDRVTKVELPFCMDQEEYEEKMEACQEAATEILEMAEEADDPELAIYDYITENCTYDADHPDAATIYGCLVQGYAKCDGISLSYKWLLEQMGRTCLCIAGDPYGGGIGHAWNVVEVDGEFYDVDVTADVDKADQQTATLYPAYHVSRYWIRDRYHLDFNLSWAMLPGSEHMDASYHALAGNFVDQNETADWEQLFLDAYQNEGSFFLQFADEDAYTEFVDNLKTNVETIAKNNQLNGWKYDCEMQDTYHIIRITVGKP